MNIQHVSLCEPPSSQMDRQALKKLVFSSVICFIFMIGEALGGILANSLAIETDAAHLLVDLISFFISILSICLAARPPSGRLNFGWHRAEAIGALFSVIFIWMITIVLVGLAVLRIASGEYEIDCKIMLITASAGLLLNVIMMIILHGGHHHHHHHHMVETIQSQGDTDIHIDPTLDSNCRHANQSHESNPNNRISSSVLETLPLLGGCTLPSGNRPGRSPGRSYTRDKPLAGVSVRENINVRAAFIHVLGDLVQSLGVVIAAIVIYFKPEYKIADPICTFFFSFLVLCTTLQILKDTILILMEGCPKHVNQNELKTCLMNLPRVRSVHSLRIWVLKVDRLVASVHLVLERRSEDSGIQQSSDNEVMLAAQKIFKELFTISDFTIQMEESVDDDDDDVTANGGRLVPV